MAHAKTADSIHVRLDRPIDKRKAILQTTINAVELLQRGQLIKEIRKEKVEAMEELRSTLSEIKKLHRAIKIKDMPLGSKQLVEVHDVGGKQMIKPSSAPKPRAPKPKSSKKPAKKLPKRSAIDKQLDDLRRKLETL